MALSSIKRFFLCGAFIGALCSALQREDIVCKIQKHAFQGREISVNLQDTVSLNCSVLQGGPVKQITWSKDGNGKEPQRHSILTSESVPGVWSTLRLSNVSEKDAGGYNCVVKNAVQPDVCAVVLHVNSPPRILKATGFFTTTPQVLSEGHNPVFHCYAGGWPKPSLSWLKDGKIIKDGDGLYSYALTSRKSPLGFSGLELKILYVRQKEHGGRYICVAKNKFGEERHQIKLSVRKKFPVQPPKVHPYASVDQVAIRRSGNALLTCVGENTPDESTVVSWAFKGKTLPLDSKDDLHHVSDFVYFKEQSTPKVNFSLLIRNVTEKDTGAYQCEVLTLKGSDSDIIYLSIVEPNSQDGKHKASLTEFLLVGAGIFCGLLTAAIAHRHWSKRRRHSKHEMKSTDFQFDVFISFSTLDYNWVRDSLTPVLDRKRINYCIHSRDFIVGKTIIENIADSVYNSRKVLAIISRNYLASNFCREELQIALHRCTEMADSSLLLIRLDGVDKKNLPKTLRRRTFLDYSSTSERTDWEERLLKQIELDERGVHVRQGSNDSTDMIQLIRDSNVINL